MKKYIYLIILLLCFSCNPYYKEYQRMNAHLPKSNFYREQRTLIKAILKKEKEPFILVITWDKSMFLKENMSYKALIYNPRSQQKKTLKISKSNPKDIIMSSNISDRNFKEIVYILDNYLNGKEEYLLSLQDSFTSSEVGSPFYIYDFINNKKLKINSIFFDKDGKIIQ